jgi:integrase
MLTNALNVKKIAALGKDDVGMHADGAGLYLRVAPSGSKSWVFVYQWEKKRKEMGLGGVRDVPLSIAREKAFEARQAVKAGRDPKAQMAAPEGVPTFGEAANALVDGLEGGWKNAKHRQQWRNSLKTYCKDLWSRPINTIATADVQAVLNPIWLTKSETATRVRSRMERVFAAAKVAGHYAGDNPAAWAGNLKELMPKQSSKSLRGHHAAMPYTQVPAFFAALRPRLSTAARALEFLILTAARTGEVLGARWREIDGDVWTVPADRMKMEREHRVPLTAEALAVLKRQGLDDPGRNPNAFIFASARPSSAAQFTVEAHPGEPLSNMSMAMLMRRMESNDWTVHGFRSSFRDWAGEETDHAREVAEAALAHQVGNAVELSYRRGDALAKRRRLMDDWAAFVAPIGPKRAEER